MVQSVSQPQTSELELETLKSASVMQADEAVASKTSAREIALWSAAAVMAIVIGVIPALWINRWRDDGTPPPTAAPKQQPQATATETIEMAEDEPAAYTPTRATTIAPHAAKPTRPTRAKPERVKHPPPPARARKPPAAAPCDVYLHPKGCPR